MNTITLHDINVKAQAILARELAPMEFLQFFRQYEPGHGDYTKDREQILGQLSLDQIVAEVRNMEKNAQ
jgi:hypothetical protein